MHSKSQIWDFFTKSNEKILADFSGTLAISSFDPLALMLVKNFLVKGAEGRVIHYKTASEVNRNWIEEEFQTLSFFGNSDSFFIHQAQDLNVEMIDLLSKLEIESRFLCLSFESENAGWKKIVKDKSISTLVIEPPKFWELNKMLDFVCDYLQVPLDYQSRAWLLEALENDLPNFYNACSVIKLNHPDADKIGLGDVKELLTLERLDQFALASLYSRKKFPAFFDKVVALEGDFEKSRFFFNFLQSHLIKMNDTSYLNQKPRLTQYDKDIQATSKLWKDQELIGEIERFNRWELMCKKKDRMLWHEIREAHLRVSPRGIGLRSV